MAQNMGIGKLGNPHLIFVRKFRFTLKGKYLEESYNTDVEINYSKKTISFATYEVFVNNEIPIHVWADSIESQQHEDEELILTTFNGIGESLYAKKFTGLKITDRSNKFDYSDNDVSKYHIILTYENCEKIPVKEKEIELNFLNSKIFIPK